MARVIVREAQWLALGGLIAVMAGCATTRGQQLVPMFWPGPPETTRIRFVTAFASERELGKRTNLAESLINFVAGKPPVSHLHNPIAIAVSDDANRIYVSDFSQQLVYRFDVAERKVTLIGQNGDLFKRPGGIALDGAGNLYVVDNFAKAVVVVDPQGKPVRRITDPGLERPMGIAIDGARGKVYVADTSHQDSSNHNVKVFDLEGKRVGTVGDGKGQGPGGMLFPTYVAVDRTGNLYVGDTMNARVDVFDPEGKFLRAIGDRGDTAGSFSRPKGVALDSFGNLYVVDSDWANVQIFNPKGEALMYFGGRGRYPGLLNNPSGIAIDRENRIYVADTQNFRVDVYQLVNTKSEDSFVGLPETKRETKKGGEDKTASGQGVGSKPREKN